MYIKFETAETLCSILNFLWDKNKYEWGSVEETGFGFIAGVRSKQVECFEMADGESFKHGLKELWNAIQNGDID